jgi:hypothetical protein
MPSESLNPGESATIIEFYGGLLHSDLKYLVSWVHEFSSLPNIN